eukprot:c33673_g1_i1.p1 GENE.c33673_g1_i1~~c33673_g1_i1.p1  ORF type:complete len:245 (-),score=35.71 c33673_g1_i1:36-770(-)
MGRIGPEFLPVVLMCAFMSSLVFGLVFGLYCYPNLRTLSFKRGSALIISKQEHVRICNRTQCSRAEIYVTLTLQSGAQLQTTIYDTVIGSFSSGSKSRFLNRYAIGSTYPAWYDPKTPTTAILVKNYPYAAIVLSVIFGIWLLLSCFALLAFVICATCNCDFDDCERCCHRITHPNFSTRRRTNATELFYEDTYMAQRRGSVDRYGEAPVAQPAEREPELLEPLPAYTAPQSDAPPPYDAAMNY